VKPFPWWIVGVAAATLIIGGGIAWWMMSRGDPALIHVVGRPLDEARRELSERNFTVSIAKPDSLTGEVAPGTVLRQEPDTGTAVGTSEEFLSDTNRNVQLQVEGESRRVPPLVGILLLRVPEIAQNAGILLDSIRLVGTSDLKRHFTVQQQVPDSNTLIAPDQKVQLFVWNYTRPCNTPLCLRLRDSLIALRHNDVLRFYPATRRQRVGELLQP
jgi:beta-lactam-binding protein with PASTA domain